MILTATQTSCFTRTEVVQPLSVSSVLREIRITRVEGQCLAEETKLAIKDNNIAIRCLTNGDCE